MNSNAPESLYDHFEQLAGLGSDESSFVTAADLVVDGGWMNV